MKEKISKTLKKEFFERFATLITGAFTFVAALAWNEAIQNLIKKYISSGRDVWSQLIYAVMVTLVAIIVIMQLNAITHKLEDEAEAVEKKLEALKKKK